MKKFEIELLNIIDGREVDIEVTAVNQAAAVKEVRKTYSNSSWDIVEIKVACK